MKKINLSIITILGSSSLLMAGGDIREITSYEMEDIKKSETIDVIPVVPTPPATPKLIAPIPKKIPITVKKVEESSPLGIYAGFGLVAVKYDTNCNCSASSKKSGIDKTAGFIGRLGYDFNNYIGLEARGLITTFKDDGGKVKHLGVFLKPMFPITEELKSYGLLGFAKTTTQGSLRRTDVNGLAFGLGLDYAFTDSNFGFFTDYEKLYYKSGSPKLDALSVGLTYDF